MDFYKAYKPFRNYLRRFDLRSGLVDVWRYSLHVADGVPLPREYELGRSFLPTGPLKRTLYPWDLDLLARELVLNAGTRGDRSLKNWNDLAAAINHIRHLEEKAFLADPSERDALFELHRHVQRQFPWHPANAGVNPLVRYLKVFGKSAVEAVVMREIGMTMKQYIQLGLGVAGHFMTHEGMSTNLAFHVNVQTHSSSD
jgi:hypothetical protein